VRLQVANTNVACYFALQQVGAYTVPSAVIIVIFVIDHLCRACKMGRSKSAFKAFGRQLSAEGKQNVKLHLCYLLVPAMGRFHLPKSVA
jgi:hypothetical protein